MRSFNIHYAKTHLSRLVDEAAEGEPFVIAKAGKPKAYVTPVSVSKNKPGQRIGFMKGMYSLPRNFASIGKRLDREILKLLPGRGGK